jgi:acyl-CoA synthetase (AMP-forming)/AMP-acid ligase II
VRGLARYKWPDEVRIVDAIPLLASGKPDRGALRQDQPRRKKP